ncbi:MAG TPA: bifunctional adenosylcobinamide kinase/adenosylcobinamide-phosphate guanylyltransferase [Streptosporangiaceae bacterium]|nr:bifunctional adenosylcobinamide kinase/adenosylcobinamide-phosphate guanylyltransferase [Streptosporangiaceae bacterium]
MDVRFLGTGGAAGWPEPGCRCASCRRAAAGGGRRPGGVLVDGQLRIDPGQPPRGVPARYRVAPVPGGWDITGPDGGRLLIAGGPGQVPSPPAGTLPFHLLLLDLLAGPAQLGALRAQGLAGAGAVAAVLCADHRISSAPELARRAALWRAAVPGDGDTLRAAAPGPGPDPGPDPGGGPHRTLVVGGARSGKSREAELRLAAEPRVTYLAAGPWPDGAGPAAGGPGADPEWARRVAAHRAARPSWWPTVESADVAGALGRLDGAVLVDGIGTWLTAVMTEAGAWPEPGAAGPGAGALAPGPADPAALVAARVDELVAAWRQTAARVVAVSDQVGAGVVPATPAGRLFRDQLGWLNQRLAAESEETVLVVAGRVLSLPG